MVESGVVRFGSERQRLALFGSAERLSVGRRDVMPERVECETHGPQEATFVCSHLVASPISNEPVGFFWSPTEGTSRGDAWCSRCEEVRLRCGGDWNDESESFAQIQLLCGACWDRVKQSNEF